MLYNLQNYNNLQKGLVLQNLQNVLYNLQKYKNLQHIL